LARPSDKLRDSRQELLFELAVCLVQRKADSLKIANALRIPVHFEAAFEEELEEISRSREMRGPLRVHHSGRHVDDHLA